MMSNEELQNILAAAYPDTTFTVKGDGRHFSISAVGEIFTNLKTLQRQQKINEAIGQYLNDGSVHAVVYDLLTPEQYNNRKTK